MKTLLLKEVKQFLSIDEVVKAVESTFKVRAGVLEISFLYYRIVDESN